MTFPIECMPKYACAIRRKIAELDLRRMSTIYVILYAGDDNGTSAIFERKLSMSFLKYLNFPPSRRSGIFATMRTRQVNILLLLLYYRRVHVVKYI